MAGIDKENLDPSMVKVIVEDSDGIEENRTDVEPIHTSSNKSSQSADTIQSQDGAKLTQSQDGAKLRRTLVKQLDKLKNILLPDRADDNINIDSSKQNESRLTCCVSSSHQNETANASDSSNKVISCDTSPSEGYLSSCRSQPVTKSETSSASEQSNDIESSGSFSDLFTKPARVNQCFNPVSGTSACTDSTHRELCHPLSLSTTSDSSNGGGCCSESSSFSSHIAINLKRTDIRDTLHQNEDRFTSTKDGLWTSEDDNEDNLVNVCDKVTDRETSDDSQSLLSDTVKHVSHLLIKGQGRNATVVEMERSQIKESHMCNTGQSSYKHTSAKSHQDFVDDKQSLIQKESVIYEDVFEDIDKPIMRDKSEIGVQAVIGDQAAMEEEERAFLERLMLQTTLDMSQLTNTFSIQSTPESNQNTNLASDEQSNTSDATSEAEKIKTSVISEEELMLRRELEQLELDVNMAVKRSELERLAERLSPPVCMDHVTGKENMRQRLILAIRKAEGHMKDIDMLEQIFMQSQLSDDDKRHRLGDHLAEFEHTLAAMGEGLPLLHLPDDTVATITQHRGMLEERGCPIVVAGEVSSGKSTLLNLFLGDSKLPVSTLSCTGRVCELTYDDRPHALLVTTKGEVQDIAMSELEEVINMQGKDDTFNKFDVVRLFLPIPFLKSGITLIDTPGIGQDMEDSSIVKAYVKDHDVFGFIFTIHSSAAGGVNQKFRNLLQTLAGEEYTDKNGHRKLDPRSVIFVCNFWDSVPSHEKESTRAHITDTIRSLPFMAGFEEDKQLFFLDSKKAYSEWRAGFITPDYDRLIDGMANFFKVGQVRKIKQSYIWIENLIQRSLHSLRSFLCWAQQQRVMALTSVDALIAELEYLKITSKNQHSTFVGLVDCNAERLGGKLLEFLQGSDTQAKFGKWSLENLGNVHKYNNVKEIFEYKLDELVDERIAEVLLEWESRYKYISCVQGQLAEGIHLTFEILNRELDRFERELRCTDSTDSVNSELKFKDGTDQDLDEVKEFVQVISPTGKEDFQVSYSTTHGNKIMSGKGITMRIKKWMGRKQSFQIPNRYSETYNTDLLKHMRCRSLAVVANLCNEAHCKGIIRQQFDPVLCFFDDKLQALKIRLNQNVALVKNLTRNVDFIVGNNKWYEEYTGKLKSLFDKLLVYNSLYISSQEQRDSEILSHEGDTKWFQAGLYGSIELTRFKATSTPITVKTLQDPTNTGKAMRESDVFTLINTLKAVKKLSFIPTYMGSCYSSSALVFSGHLPTARHQLLATARRTATHFDSSIGLRHSNAAADAARSVYERIVGHFLQELAQALQYIHLEKLVHIELSLDSVLVRHHQMNIFPMLTSLSEKRQLDFPEDTTHIRVGNFLYLPPEVLQENSSERMNRWYRTPGDMYGLGVMMVELWYQQYDIFLERKQDSLKEWMSIPDPGKELMEEALRLGQRPPPCPWLKLIRLCLRKDLHDRISARHYLRDIVDIMDRSPSGSPPSDKQSTISKPITCSHSSGSMAAPRGGRTRRPSSGTTPPRPQGFTQGLEESIESISPHMLNNPTQIPNKAVKKLALRTSDPKSDMDSIELADFFSSVKLDSPSPCPLSPDAYPVFSLTHLLDFAPDYAIYTTGVTLRAMQETLASSSSDKGYSVKDIADILGTCSPKHPTRPVYGIEDALRLGSLKDRVMWTDLPEIRKTGINKCMTQQECELQEALFEIVSSEASYLKSLQFLMSDVMYTLEAEFGLKKGCGDNVKLFSNIKKVQDSSYKLFADFESLWSRNYKLCASEVCQVLQKFYDDKQSCDAYIIYYSNHVYQQRKLTELKEKPGNEEFCAYVDRIGDNRLSLIDGYLSLPIQRIPRYKILIEAVINTMADEDFSTETGAVIERCLDSAMTLCELCDGAVKRMQDMEYMTKLDQNMDFMQLRKHPVVSESHEYIRGAEVQRIAPKSAFWAWPWVERWRIDLFNDVIFFSKISGEKLQVQGYCHPKSCHASHLDTLVANVQVEGGVPAECHHILQVTFLDNTYTGSHQHLYFNCLDESELLRWVECISPPMSQQNSRYGQVDYLHTADSPMVVVMRPFTSANPDEMNLYEGEVLRIRRRIQNSDWCEGEKLDVGERGWFPRSHTAEIDCIHKRRKILTSQQRLVQMTRKIQETRRQGAAPPQVYGVGVLQKLTRQMLQLL